MLVPNNAMQCCTKLREISGKVPGPGRVEYRARRRVNVKEGGPGQAGRRAESDGERRRQTEKGWEE